ncbi:MAG TPA: hypothetical protein VMF11_14085 [Candidatus Baltobacteraceae bacterium]|nr:hypothetical protein [Candidatus Baltobacteraceae bacterium]
MLCAVAAALSFAPARAAAPDPYAIFADARAYWLQQVYPQRLEYDVAIDVTQGGREKVERYLADYDAVRDVIAVDPISDYQLAHPTIPKGVDLSILGLRLNKPLPPIDFLGVPRLAPTYSFGMAPFVPAPTPTPFNSAALVAQIRQEFHDPNPRERASASPSPGSSLQEIATVVARNRDYTIALLGTDTIDGHPCYHLGLTPTRDPGRFRIRQAWIDEHTFAPWQLQDALNFVSGPGTNVAWMIHFAEIGGAHYVSEEDAQAPMATGGEIYTKTAIRFENIHAVADSSLPQALVDSVGTALEEPSWP